ncbi:MAG: caspase family protein [Vicinamibacterales bacterium]
MIALLAAAALLFVPVHAQDRRLAPTATSARPRGRALVIGNDAYARARLQNAVADATAISDALRELDFDVTSLTDVPLAQFERQVDAFAAGLSDGDVAVFYFSGHGVEVDGENYLIPVDFNGIDAADLKARAYSAQRVQAKLETRSRLRILILDACRDNPFRAVRSGAGGLAAMTAKGSLIAFATAPGGTASDNPRGRNGLFTQELLEALKEPGLTASELFRTVRERVDRASGGRQFPWIWDGLIGNFAFRPGPSAAPGVATDKAPVPLPMRDRPQPAGRFDRPSGPARPVVSRSLNASAGAAYGVSLSPGSRFIATGYEDGSVRLWDPAAGKQIGEFAGLVGNVSTVAVSPDNRRLAASSGDRVVRIWDLDSKTEVSRLSGHSDAVLAIAFSPDGRELATASADNTIRLWTVETGAARDTLLGHRDAVTGVSYNANGRQLLSASRDGTVRVWDPIRARETMAIEVGRPVTAMAATRDFRLVAAGDPSGMIEAWDAESGLKTWSLRAPHRGTVWALTFSADGALLASGGADGQVRLFRGSTAQALGQFSHADWVRGVAFNDDGTWLVSSSGDGDVHTWRVTR